MDFFLFNLCIMYSVQTVVSYCPLLGFRPTSYYCTVVGHDTPYRAHLASWKFFFCILVRCTVVQNEVLYRIVCVVWDDVCHLHFCLSIGNECTVDRYDTLDRAHLLLTSTWYLDRRCCSNYCSRSIIMYHRSSYHCIVLFYSLDLF